MVCYQSKYSKLKGSTEREIYKQAKLVFSKIEKRTKRKPYIRSAYFKKQKIFFDYFWVHVFQTSPRIRRDRLKYFAAAIDLLEHSRNKPTAKPNPNKRSETLYRFVGLTKEKELFFVQVKENPRKKKLQFMSLFSLDT